MYCHFAWNRNVNFKSEIAVWLNRQLQKINFSNVSMILFSGAGVRQEQDIYVRLIDSVTKQVSSVQEQSNTNSDSQLGVGGRVLY